MAQSVNTTFQCLDRLIYFFIEILKTKNLCNKIIIICGSFEITTDLSIRIVIIFISGDIIVFVPVIKHNHRTQGIHYTVHYSLKADI